MMTSIGRKDLLVPQAKKIAQKLVNHGHSRIDDYYWLNDKNNPEVLKYLKEENNYIEQSLEHTKNLRKELFQEITDRIKPEESSVPYFDNGYYYYHRFEINNEHPIYCRKMKFNSDDEEVLLNVNLLSEDIPNIHIGDLSVSPDNKKLAFSVDTLGDNEYSIKFKDLENGEILKEVIPNTDGDIEWANDNKTIFYIKKESETLREYQLWKHVLGSDCSQDVLVYEETDESFYLSISKSKSDKYILLGSFNTVTTEYRYLQADSPDSNFNLISEREKGHEYYVETHGSELFILTNLGSAANFKLLKTSFDKLHKDFWQEVIPYNDDILIDDFEVFRDYIVLNERKGGLVYLKVYNIQENKFHYLDCGEDVYEIWISENNEYETQILRFGYSSLTTPSSIFEYNMKTKSKTLLKQKFAGIDFEKGQYISKRIYTESEDGLNIPISIVYRSSMNLEDAHPLLIYAYGAYGFSIDAGFQNEILSLLDRGFIYAIAHVRGGQELGRKWYDSGRLLSKMNTFNDFITCTEYLHKLGYSTPNKTFALGESAGGLLMGVISNRRPDLYAGIISEVPFIDVVTTMSDQKIPLTTGEYEEWGNPETKEYYDYMLSYSPYDQIKEQEYPAMLITTGFNDSQVQYWEPAKWIAKLRDFNVSKNSIFLHTNFDAGHGGNSGRYETYQDTALIYSFILDVLSNDSDK